MLHFVVPTRDSGGTSGSSFLGMAVSRASSSPQLGNASHLLLKKSTPGPYEIGLVGQLTNLIGRGGRRVGQAQTQTLVAELRDDLPPARNHRPVAPRLCGCRGEHCPGEPLGEDDEAS